MNGKIKSQSCRSGFSVIISGLCLSGALAAAAAPQPVVYYDFEQGSGSSVVNLGTMGGSGTLINSPLWVTGTPGVEDGGLEFNGAAYATATYVDTGILAVDMGVHKTGAFAPFTMSAWVKGGKPEIEGSSYNDEFVFGQLAANNVLHLGIRDQRAHFGNWGDDLTASAFVMATGTWYHVVWQLSESNVQRIYINGELKGSRQSTGVGIKSNLNIVIGTSTTGSRTLKGPVDDTAIYTNVLSISQIQFLAAGGSPTNLPERVLSDDGYFTAPTGTNNTWNLYRVLGGTSGPALSWYEAYQQSQVPDPVDGTVTSHMVTISNSTENEFCRYMRNYFNIDAWIGLTDSNATNVLGEALFPGAYESGNTTTVPDVNTRRNNGWVWVNGEPYDGSVYQNWNGVEPNDSPSEDAVVLTGTGFWNDYGSGIPGSGDATNRLLAIIEWDLNSPDPIPGAIRRAAVLPPSAAMPGDDGSYGSFAGVWVRGAGVVNSTYAAVAALTSGQGTVITTKKNIPVINAYDPESTASKEDGLFQNNSPFFGDQPGILESNCVALYRGQIKIPEGGDYTFGVHSAAGFALRFPGTQWKAVYGAGWLDHGDLDHETMMYDYDTDDSNTRGVITLSEGVHAVEFLVWCDVNGKRSHELYAAKGAFANDADTDTWRLVGHKSIGAVTYVGVDPAWTLWHSQNEAVGNLNAAWAAVSNYVAVASNQSAWAEINFWDPQSGQQGQLLNSAPFPWDTAADDNTKALYAVTKLNIPAEMTIGLGFQGDDGSRLTVSNQTWNSLVEAVNASSVIVGDSLEHNVGTGNSRTVGSISLTNGTYDVSVLWWEGSGGSYLDVFQKSIQAYEGQLPASYLYRTLSTTSGETVPDYDGLQLIGNRAFYLFVR